MRWLIDRVHAAWRALRDGQLPPTRVGLLNTGELVLIDGLGQPLVISAETTNLVRDALEPEFSEMFIDLTRGAVGATD